MRKYCVILLLAAGLVFLPEMLSASRVVHCPRSSDTLAVPFLENILVSRAGEKLRGKAALELGEFDTERSLKVLFQAAKSDGSLYVRKKAVSTAWATVRIPVL